MQSAYLRYRSFETALLRVTNDWLLAVGKGQEAVLVLLDYSATFNTVDHDIMLQHLHWKYSISNMALDWFTSYFTNRQQSILVNGTASLPHHGLRCMIYADDVQP